MKTLVLTSVICMFIVQLHSQIVNIPDQNFKDCLLANTEINTNMDDEIQESEALAYTGEIDCWGMGIDDLTGIEAFVNLTGLICGDNNLTTLDVSNNAELTILVTGRNNLTSIDVSNNTSLDTLLVNKNQINTFDVSALPDLLLLNVWDNPLNDLDLSQNPILEELWIMEMTNLSALDLSNNPELKNLFCSNNLLLGSLDLRSGNNGAIIEIGAESNPNLFCIDVDDPAYSEANWVGANFNFNPGIIFSEDCSLGFEENALDALSIYPNPTKDVVHFSKPVDVIVSSVNGQLLASKTNVDQMDVSHLGAGMYFLTLKKDQQVKQMKLMKE